MRHVLCKRQKQHLQTRQSCIALLQRSGEWSNLQMSGIAQWNALANNMPTRQIPFIGDYVRIVCSLCNDVRPPLPTSSPTDDITAERMITLSEAPNSQNKKSNKMTLMSMSFQNWSSSEKQAHSYISTAEHLSEHGQNELILHEEQPGIIKI